MHGMKDCIAQLPVARHACDAEGIKAPACLLMVLDEELAGLELVWIHHVEQLPPRGIVFLQILSVELLRATLGLSGGSLLHEPRNSDPKKHHRCLDGINAMSAPQWLAFVMGHHTSAHCTLAMCPARVRSSQLAS